MSATHVCETCGREHLFYYYEQNCPESDPTDSAKVATVLQELMEMATKLSVLHPLTEEESRMLRIARSMRRRMGVR